MQTKKTDNLQSFAVRLRATLKRRGVTLQKVADALNVSTSTVGAWSQAKNFPEVELHVPLANFLGEPVQWLIYGLSPEYPENTEGVETAVRESQQIISGNEGLKNRMAVESDRLKINPGFRPPAGEPTAEDCLNYLTMYLREAKEVPGMVGFAWIQLHEHLSIEKLRKIRENLPISE